VPIFVDTNVLVYARDASEKRKQPRAHEWLTHLWVTHEGRLSFQVLAEYYTVVTRRLRPGMAAADARADAAALLAWRPAVIDDVLLVGAWDIEEQASVSFWDALIVAAARAQDCTAVLTEDLQDGQTIGGVTVIDPFSHEPGFLPA
jgi:predicted nucleic acid-binding protein